VKLTGGVTTIDHDGLEKTAHQWEIIEPAAPEDLSPGESALQGLSSTARPAFLEKGQVLVYDPAMNLFSSGIVIDSILVMARHKTAGLSHLVVKGTNSDGAGPGRQVGVRVGMDRAHYLDSYGAPKWDEKKHTCTFLDFMAIPLEKDEISMIGVKTYKDRDLTRNYELQRGTITYSNDDFGSVIKEDGSIPEGLTKVHNLGLALAYIVSQPGASSSGVVVVQNGPKLAGMWLGTPAHSLKKHRGHTNLFMHTDAITANLAHFGLVKSPLIERIKQWGDSLCAGESRESKKERAARMWAEYLQDYDDDQSEFDSLMSDAEDHDNEMVHGHARTKKISNKPLIRLPPAVVMPPVQNWQLPGESLGSDALDGAMNGGSTPGIEMEALSVAIQHNRIDLDRKVKEWKYGLLNGDTSRVLKEISYYAEEASGDVRDRLKAVLAVPSNSLLVDYMRKVAPEWLEGNLTDVIPDKNGNPYFLRVGSYAAQGTGKPKKARDHETELQQRLKGLAGKYFEEKRHGCIKGEYKIPASTKKNIDRSLRAQAKLAVATAPQLNSEQQEDFDAAVKLVREKYSAGIEGYQFQSYLEEGELGFLKTFLAFEDKSSGISARYRNMKKSAWVKHHPEEVVDLALSRVILLAVAGEQLKELDAVELVKYGCADVKDIFMKAEEHSPQKTAEGRFRLIWGCSLIDITVQSLLHKADNAAHVDAYQIGKLTCAALGMGHSPEGLRHLVRAFEQEGIARNNVTSDATAFDLSVDGIFIHSDGERRADNCSNDDVGRLVRRYAHILCSHVINNQGEVWQVLKYGVTASGQLSTTAQNTFARSVMAAYGGCKGWTCAGDDLVGDENFDEGRLLHFGVRSRDVERHENEADFTSHLIDTTTCTAVFGNVEKLLWHLYDTCIDVSANRERFGAVLYLLRDTPGVLEDIASIARDMSIDTAGYVADSFLAQDMA
jgi:hypothetical protein